MRLTLGHIRSVPPSATKSLKQSSGVCIAIGLRLNEVDHGLLIRLFCAQERQIIGVSGLILFLCQIERHARGILCGCCCLQGIGILLEGIQSVRDVLKCGQYRAAILFGGLSISGFRGALAVQQGASVKNRLRNACAYISKARSARE